MEERRDEHKCEPEFTPSGSEEQSGGSLRSILTLNKL